MECIFIYVSSFRQNMEVVGRFLIGGHVCRTTFGGASGSLATSSAASLLVSSATAVASPLAWASSATASPFSMAPFSTAPFLMGAASSGTASSEGVSPFIFDLIPLASTLVTSAAVSPAATSSFSTPLTAMTSWATVSTSAVILRIVVCANYYNLIVKLN